MPPVSARSPPPTPIASQTHNTVIIICTAVGLLAATVATSYFIYKLLRFVQALVKARVAVRGQPPASPAPPPLQLVMEPSSMTLRKKSFEDGSPTFPSPAYPSELVEKDRLASLFRRASESPSTASTLPASHSSPSCITLKPEDRSIGPTFDEDPGTMTPLVGPSSESIHEAASAVVGPHPAPASVEAPQESISAFPWVSQDLKFGLIVPTGSVPGPPEYGRAAHPKLRVLSDIANQKGSVSAVPAPPHPNTGRSSHGKKGAHGFWKKKAKENGSDLGKGSAGVAVSRSAFEKENRAPDMGPPRIPRSVLGNLTYANQAKSPPMGRFP